MPNYTPIYNLKKPLGSENYNVLDQNGNMDILDVQIKTVADNAIPLSQKGAVGGVASYDAVATSLADMSSQAVDKGASLIGLNDIDTLFTATNVEGALKEVFTFANNGKTSVASAITTKGVSASSSDTFSVLATKVGQIESVLTGNMVAGDLLSGKTGYSNNPLSKITGTMVAGKHFATGTKNADASGNLIITGLSFAPHYVFTNVGTNSTPYTLCRKNGFAVKMVYGGAISTVTFTPTSTGFTISGFVANSSNNWLAIEQAGADVYM